MASLSRQLAQWIVGLRYDDLPPAVIDRAKGVTLHSLASVRLVTASPGVRCPTTTSCGTPPGCPAVTPASRCRGPGRRRC